MSAFTSRAGWVVAGVSAVLGASVFLSPVGAAAPAAGDKAADKSPDKAAPDKKPAAAASAMKLPKPWGEIPSLSDEQKTKIHELHAKALAQVSEIEKQEKADCMALLTDEQKSELKAAMAKDRKDAAVRSVARQAGTPTTAPAK